LQSLFDAYLASRYFGLHAFGRVFAAQYLFVGRGAALGARPSAGCGIACGL
jgi:hypothetical protein